MRSIYVYLWILGTMMSIFSVIKTNETWGHEKMVKMCQTCFYYKDQAFGISKSILLCVLLPKLSFFEKSICFVFIYSLATFEMSDEAAEREKRRSEKMAEAFCQNYTTKFLFGRTLKVFWPVNILNLVTYQKWNSFCLFW